MDWATLGAAIGVSLFGGGLINGILIWWLDRKRIGHQHSIDTWDRIQQSYEREIEQLEKVADTEKAKHRRMEYAEQQAAWRAQQGVAALAPREVRLEGGSSLTADELEELRNLLAASRPLEPAALSAEDYFLRGNSYYDSEDYQEALAAYNRSLELRPNDPATLNNRGNAFGNLGRYEEALQDYTHSAELNPHDARILYNRGLALYKLERYDEALGEYDNSSELNPHNPDALT